ncbi:MAG TPA: glycerol-3-phosphate dehydrogenase [Burkholderiales bacterium]|nr:glycerol-3-phosphate dehydrogenase [Burkholderiales bacterium]
MDIEHYDLLIIGGGVNGAGIARDAAGRGIKVLLVEQGDLASATSSASTKLIHGGLRYLEYFEFRLVAEALAERETLLGIAPHIIWPMEFVLPHESHLRPAWLIRAGLFLYDHLGHGIPGFGPKSSLPSSKGIRLLPEGYGAGLKPEFERGFVYYDCWVDDARLVVLNARSAAALGATILPRTRLVWAKRENGRWVARLSPESGESRTVHAGAIVNAAGPWVRQVLDELLKVPLSASVRLVKGSHIVVPRIHAERHAFILQNPDRRVIFMIPYERQFTLVGTTDVPVTRDDFRAKITRKEIEYLCEAASRYAQTPITPGTVVWSYSGVRPLYDDGSEDPAAVTRDYHLILDKGAWPNDPPLLSVFGGKITTYRKLAEQALAKLAWRFPGKSAWTHTEALPGGDLGGRTFRELLLDFRRRYPRLPKMWMTRVLRRHGSLAEEIIGDAHVERELGRYFGGGLYEREVDYLVRNEWAREADDVLWRRTKCGLHMTGDEKTAVRDYLAKH